MYNSMNLVASGRLLVVSGTTFKQMQLSHQAVCPLCFLTLRAKDSPHLSLVYKTILGEALSKQQIPIVIKKGRKGPKETDLNRNEKAKIQRVTLFLAIPIVHKIHDLHSV